MNRLSDHTDISPLLPHQHFNLDVNGQKAEFKEGRVIVTFQKET